jgi:hypothetical protein
MSTSIATPSAWPARAAYFSAAIFTGSSGTINVTYGWQKGGDLAGSLTWAAVAAAVAVVFALSWPALIRSLEARRWSAALVALVALVLAGSYSVTAALGSAAGGRANAATTESATTDARKKAQDAYDAAKAELPTLKPARPVAELEAIIARNPEAGGRCAIQNGTGRLVCPPHPLAPELARAKRRAELETKIEREAAKLANAGPAKQANSDARTLARYLQAVGVNTTPEHLNDLLVLLAVLMIEAGGGLSLALGMALSAPPVAPAEVRMDGKCSAPEHPRTPRPNAQAHSPTERSNTAKRTPDHLRPMAVRRASGVAEWLAQQGGRAETSRRRLATVLGRSPSGVHDELRRLAASGAITMTTGPRGTLLALRPNASAKHAPALSEPRQLLHRGVGAAYAFPRAPARKAQLGVAIEHFGTLL